MSHDHAGAFRFCPHCAAPLRPTEAGGRERVGCPECGFVHWRDPAVGAAVVVFDAVGSILLVQRALGSTRAGLWSIPAGFVDHDEDIRAAAARELLEETGLVAEVGEVVNVASNFHDPAKPTVGVWFSGVVTGGELAAGDDAADASYFSLDDLPPLAFPTDEELLHRLADR